MDQTVSPAILTKITNSQLECTVFVHAYRCLLKLRSKLSANSSQDQLSSISGHRSSKCYTFTAIPDIATLTVVPIFSDHYHAIDDEGIPLIHGHIGSSPVVKKMRNGEFNIRADWSNHQHSFNELINISNDLKKHLPTRLKDVLNGVLLHNKKSDVTMQTLPSERLGEFLRYSDAIFHEFLLATRQYLSKEQAHSEKLHFRHGKKRPRATMDTDRNNTSLLGTATKRSPPLQYYSALLCQLRKLQEMPDVVDISLHKDASSKKSNNSDLTRLSVTCVDENGRKHTWHAELYPYFILSVDLPEKNFIEERYNKRDKWWEEKDDSSISVLLEIQHQFQLHLKKYQLLFNELDDLDSQLFILEPNLPATRCVLERRIALWEGGASIMIQLDPENPRNIPELVRFIGVTTNATAEAAASKGVLLKANVDSNKMVDLRSSFAQFVLGENQSKNTSTNIYTLQNNSDDAKSRNQQIHCEKRWSKNRSIRENLQAWFGANLPSPSDSVKDNFLVECGICYSYHLPVEENMTAMGASLKGGSIPEAKCGNPRCNKHYHQMCLFDWLNSLPTARVSFDHIFGSCPYCCAALSVKILKH